MRKILVLFFFLLLTPFANAATEGLLDGGYAVVVSEKTNALPAWRAIVETLVKKYDAQVVTYPNVPSDALPKLQKLFPRYVCFVVQHNEASRDFVRACHLLTRKFDDDPYGDALWSILTGYDVTDAARIANAKPLTIERVAAGTSVPLEKCKAGTWYCELTKNQVVSKKAGGKVERRNDGPSDTTQAIADLLTKEKAQLFVTSGHATERNWMIGFRYRNGFFVCKEGQLQGKPSQAGAKLFDITSTEPKVHLAVGNCLIGHIPDVNAMALALLHSGGVNQMVGYTVPTWFGYAGWGMLDYFVEQPGRYTVTEAFFANQQALLNRIETAAPGDKSRRGLVHDRDVLAIYGDPAYQAKMAAMPLAWSQELTKEGDIWTLKIVVQDKKQRFKVLDPNGSQRNGRPVIALFPKRLGEVEVIAGHDLEPLITDDFILVRLEKLAADKEEYVIRFREKK